MKIPTVRLARAILLGALLGLGAQRGAANPDDNPELFGAFTGSTPCGETVRQLFSIPEIADSPLRWKLSLNQDPKTRAPADYTLQCEYRLPAATHGEKAPPQTLEKRGRWARGKGTKTKAEAIIYELEGGVSLIELEGNVLHFLNPDRSLMIGNGGWSFTLYRTDAAEKIAPPPGDDKPSLSYTLTPLASGPSVLGVFEGRSPCYRIAEVLKINLSDCMKAKWRVTLYQDPKTLAPTTYKIEGTLYRGGAREGPYTIAKGSHGDPQSVVYQLAPTKTQAGLFLLKGDDNVLFFLDQNRKPLVGHADFSYTLNRRTK